MAPDEDNNPVGSLSHKSNEAKCFPMLYPTGGPTFHDKREENITLSRYLNACILNADSRFAQTCIKLCLGFQVHCTKVVATLV